MGISRQTLNAWMAVDDCANEIRMWIDDRKFPIDAAKLMRTLKKEGQKLIVDKYRHKDKVFLPELRASVENIHKRYPQFKLKSLYAPAKRSTKGMGSAKRTWIRSLSIPDLEEKIQYYEEEIKRKKEEINAAIPIIAKILGNRKLKLALPSDTMMYLDTFAKEEM